MLWVSFCYAEITAVVKALPITMRQVFYFQMRKQWEIRIILNGY
ncbi:hypothetical protein ASZ90_007990 [hydrocarbon metagenome]|uniref:Uncharacterized protein n=1 Tax=hydrocarbon metagenome TaxID=938273 RepID=A0A0W8FNG6_9ZZZZ